MRDWTSSSLRERLDHLLELHGGSQNALAIKAGVQGATWSRLRSRGGQRYGGEVETLDKIAAQLGVSFEWLATGRGQPTARALGEVAAPGSERWPNRSAAARVCLGAGIDSAAVGSVLADAIEAAQDPPVLWWIDRMRVRALVMRSSDVQPTAGDAAHADPPASHTAQKRAQGK